MPGWHGEPTFGIESYKRRTLKHSKPFKKHFSPLNCTSSHFIRKEFRCKCFETNFFNEIKDLEASLEAETTQKTF